MPDAKSLVFNEYVIHQERVLNYKIHTLVSIAVVSTNGTILHLSALKTEFMLTMKLIYNPPQNVLCARVEMTP